MEQDANTQAGITEWGIAAMTGGSAWRYERVGCGCVRLELLSLSLSLSLSTSQDDHTWNRMDLVAEKDSKASHSGDAPAWQEQDGCVAGQESMRLQAGRRVA